MDYDFQVSRPLPDRRLHNSSVNPTTEHNTFATRITDLTLGLLVDALIATQQTNLLVAPVPFHMFSLSDYLCDLLGLDHGCVIMLALSGELPHIEWHENDIGTLQRKNIMELRTIISTLKSGLVSPHDFILITPEA